MRYGMPTISSVMEEEKQKKKYKVFVRKYDNNTIRFKVPEKYGKPTVEKVRGNYLQVLFSKAGRKKIRI